MPTPWTTLAAPKKPKASASEIPDYFGTAVDAPEKIARLARIPGADPAIFQQFTDAEALRKVIGESTGTYLDALKANTPGVDSANASDISELERLFAPNGYQADLQGVRDRRKEALSNLDQTLFGDLRKSLSMGRLGSGGSGGLSSYLARIAAGESGKIRANEAYDAAGQERADLATLISGRQGAVGKRASLLDSNLMRLLQPIDVVNKGNTTYSAALQQAIQQALLNSMIGVGAQDTGV